MFEEESSRPVAARFMPALFDGWGVEELRQYIDALRAEIARAEAAIAARQTHRGSADALFRKPDGI